MIATPDFWFAVLFAVLFLLYCRLWFRARPDSNERRHMQIFLALLASFLLRLWPRLVWPTADRLQAFMEASGFVILIVAVVTVIRNTRRPA